MIATRKAPQRIPLADGGLLIFDHEWIAPFEADMLFRVLRDEIPWQQKSNIMFGKPVLQPRLTAWVGDPGAVYSYSGITEVPMSWTPMLDHVRRRAELTADCRFNSALLNFYRGGDDSMGAHSDDEKELGENPVIASVSLGSSRRFMFRHKTRKDVANVELLLGGGSLLVMSGTTQHFWKHWVPKQKDPTGPRVNLTFRWTHVAAPLVP